MLHTENCSHKPVFKGCDLVTGVTVPSFCVCHMYKSISNGCVTLVVSKLNIRNFSSSSRDGKEWLFCRAKRNEYDSDIDWKT